MLILIFAFVNCGGNTEQLTDEQIEQEAEKRFREVKDSIKKIAFEECTDQQQKFVETKIDSLIIEHLKNVDTISIPIKKSVKDSL